MQKTLYGLVGVLITGTACLAASSAEPDTNLRINSPESGETIACELTGEGGVLRISGSSTGLYGQGYRIILYVNPQVRGARGWFLQFGENGVDHFDPEGNWSGNVQLGNSQYPPKGGEKISIAALALRDERTEEVISKAKEAPDRPVYLLPQVPAGRLAVARDVVVNVSP